ncbi:MAG: GGDEF domain-containing protein [Coriobacteriales bacterium]|nr:GGDEF domain-containing protein [Coriobacteriales bacterium]
MAHDTKKPSRFCLRIHTVSIVALALATVLAVVAIFHIVAVFNENAKATAIHQRYEDCSNAVEDLLDASNYLTAEARLFVLTTDPDALDRYVQEMSVTNRRDEAVRTLQTLTGNSSAYAKLSNALESSNALSQRELHAILLACDAINLTPLPPVVASAKLNEEERQLSDEAKLRQAQEIMLDNAYRSAKERIEASVDSCTDELVEDVRNEEELSTQRLNGLLNRLYLVTALLLLITALSALANYVLVVVPLRRQERRIVHNEPLEEEGAQELRQVAASYNLMYEEHHRQTQALKMEAQTDALTGLLNRGAFDRVLQRETGDDMALLLLDVDLFKDINDTYGHDVGDRVLQRVAHTIAEHFRTTDYACRMGGDEFAVIMTKMHGVGRQIVSAKLDEIAQLLDNPCDDLPGTTLSVGIAFGSGVSNETSVYKAADMALYAAKNNGRNRYEFYKE